MTATVGNAISEPVAPPDRTFACPTASELAIRLRHLEDLSLRAGEANLAAHAREARERVEAGEIWLVVVGQFKRGKTSLVNRLVGDEILPTGVVPVTSVATVLRRGTSTQVTVHFRNGETEEMPPEALARYVTESGNPANERGVDRVEVRHPSRFLADGLVLVDTPGIGSLSVATTEHAYGWLPRIDAALVVLSPDPPLGASEADYVQEIAGRTQHIAFAFNKVDLFPEDTWTEALEYHRDLLAELLGTDPAEVLIHPTSSISSVESVPGGAGDLREVLRSFVVDSGSAAALEAALGRADRIRGALRAHLELERAAILTPGEILAERLGRLENRRDELHRRRREAEAILEREAQDLVREAETSLNRVAREQEPGLARLVGSVVRDAGDHGNHALARHVAERMAGHVKAAYEAWWMREGEGVRRGLTSAMERAAGLVEESVEELRAWIQEEFGVTMGLSPALRPLVDSTDFYYRVEGPLPRTTLGFLGLLAPRRLFRWTLGRRARNLSPEELKRNAGRIRGDLQYRIQETVRAFLADMRRTVEEDETALETALTRGSELQASDERARTEALAEVEARLRELRGKGHEDPAHG